MKLKHKIDYEGLEKHLLSLKFSEIETSWNKSEGLIEAFSMDEIEYFKSDKSKIPATKIIQYGEPFLVDALGNDLSIVILSKKKYKLPNGRVIKSKFVKTIIYDCRSIFGTPINGYWKIPSQFISELP